MSKYRSERALNHKKTKVRESSMNNWGTFDSKSLFKGGTLDSFTLSHFHTFALSHFHTLPHFHTSANRDKARQSANRDESA